MEKEIIKNEIIKNEWRKITDYVKVNYSNSFHKGLKLTFERKGICKKLFCITPEGNCYIEHVSRSCSNNRGYTYYSYYHHPRLDIKCLDYEERKLQATKDVIIYWEEIKHAISEKACKSKKLKMLPVKKIVKKP